MSHAPHSRKIGKSLFWVIGVAFLCVSGLVLGEDLIATVEVSGARGKQIARSTAVSPKARPESRPESRPVLEGKRDEEFTLQWTMRNAGKKPIEDVLVHFFVAEQDQTGQREPPNLRPERVVLEGALTMDFNSTNSAIGTLSFRAPKPGDYLVRVEARNLPEEMLEQPAAALDLKIR